jgi:hypothetical protein
MTDTANAARPVILRLPLRAALLLDAAVTGVNGAAYLAGAGLLTGLLGHHPATLRAVGAFLLVFAAGVALVGTRRPVPPGAAWGVVVLNLAWVVASLAAAGTGWDTPTTTGTLWTVLQAGVVAGFAALQAAALRR